ncbi:MAG: HNH endonuclease [Proteobacteria bacterium]|nr:HNH endonuclease [Pseudomonadota bacterium]MBU4275424.1 HNH endonuclease [Pseudomonadota bacterium]MBU4382701.1 HNH endonuclease [Pseudomonadota bacterium]MCG2765216.1 HNH endonuclease [Desulfarculaceae bacterium]
MTDKRDAIPAELKRRVLIEAGHRCAIHTCRHIDTEIHHIIPWEQCNKHEYENLIALCPNCHTRADKGEIDRKSLRKYKANLRYLTDKYFPWELDILFGLFNGKEGEERPFPGFMLMLIKRIIDSGLVELRESDFLSGVNEMKLNPDYIKLTEKGRDFISHLNESDLA